MVLRIVMLLTVRFFSGDGDLNTVFQSESVENLEGEIATVLESRFGDGLVYLPKDRPSYFFLLAKKEGFIDADGYLTRKGRALLARYSFN